MRSPTCPDSRLDNRKYVLDLIVCTRSRRANFCLQFVRCAEHFILQVFLTSATESTIHCAKAETSRRYNSCTSQYPNYLLTSHGLTRAVLVVSNTSKARLACQRSPWTRSHWSQKTSTLTSSAYNGKKFHTPDLLYVEYASFWILTPF